MANDMTFGIGLDDTGLKKAQKVFSQIESALASIDKGANLTEDEIKAMSNAVVTGMNKAETAFRGFDRQVQQLASKGMPKSFVEDFVKQLKVVKLQFEAIGDPGKMYDSVGALRGDLKAVESVLKNLTSMTDLFKQEMRGASDTIKSSESALESMRRAYDGIQMAKAKNPIESRGVFSGVQGQLTKGINALQKAMSGSDLSGMEAVLARMPDLLNKANAALRDFRVQMQKLRQQNWVGGARMDAQSLVKGMGSRLADLSVERKRFNGQIPDFFTDLEKRAQALQFRLNNFDFTKGTRNDFQMLKKEVAQTFNEIDKLTSSFLSESKRAARLGLKNESLDVQYRNMVSRIGSLADRSGRTRDDASKLGIDTTKIRGQISALLALRRELENLMQTGELTKEKLQNKRGEFGIIGRGVGDATSEINRQRKAQEKARREAERAAAKQGREAEKTLSSQVTLYERYLGLVRQVGEARDRAGILSAKASFSGVDNSGLSTIVSEIEARMAALKALADKGTLSSSAFNGVKDAMSALSRETTRVNAAIQYQKRLSSSMAQEHNRALAIETGVMKVRERAAAAIARSNAQRGTKALESQYGVYYSDVDKYIAKLTRLREALDNLKGKKDKGSYEEFKRLSSAVTTYTSKLRRATEEYKRQRDMASQMAASDIGGRLSMVQERLRYEIRTTTGTLMGQSRVLSQIGMQLGMVFSWYGIQNFVRSLVTMGGEFEKQHKALRSLLGDIRDADVIFGQVKQMAVKSPFTFSQLTDYTKKVAAFGIPNDELLDTMTRLADLSAGLGVDMGRIVLAYGQVRSATVLKGQELRQFTEAGIPMVEALATKLSELNKTTVTTGEVFDMIKKKQIGFDVVKEVIFDMTSEGGRFYKMQETLADSLPGKLNKLKDSWDIFLADAAAGGGILNNTFGVFLDTLSGILRELNKIQPVLLGIGTFAALRGIGRHMAYGVMGGGFTSRRGDAAYNDLAAKIRGNKETQRAILLEKQQLLGRKGLTAEERKIVAAKVQVTNQDILQAAQSGQLTQKELVRLAQSKKLSVEMRQQLLYLAGMNAEQVRIMTTSTGITRQMKLWGLSIKNGLKGIGSFFTSLFDPINLLFIALSAVFAWFYNERDKAARAMEARKAIEDDAQQHIDSIDQLFTRLEAGGDKATMSNIEEMYKTLEHHPNLGWIKQEANNITDLGKRYEFVKNKAEEWREVSDAIKEHSIEFGQFVSGWDKDDIKEKIDKLNDAVVTDAKANEIARTVEELAKGADKDYLEGFFENLFLEAEKNSDKFSRKTIENIAEIKKAADKPIHVKLKMLYVGLTGKEVNNDPYLNEFASGFYEASGFHEAFGGRTFANYRASNPLKKYLKSEESARENVDDFMEEMWGHAETIAKDMPRIRAYLMQVLSGEKKYEEFAEDERRAIAVAMYQIVRAFMDQFESIPEALKDFLARNIIKLKVGIDLSFFLKEGNDEQAYTGLAKIVDDAQNEAYRDLHKGKELVKHAFFPKEELDKIAAMGASERKKWFSEEIKKSEEAWKNLFIELEEAPYFEAERARIEQQIEDENVRLGILKALNPFPDDDKDKDGGKGGKGGGRQRDEWLEWLKHFISEFEKYVSEYQKLVGYYGKARAKAMVVANENYATFKDYDPEDKVAFYKEQVALLEKQANTEDRRHELEELRHKLASAEFDLSIKRLDIENKALERKLSLMKEEWELYKKFYDLTKNRDLSANIVYGAGGLAQADLMAEYRRELAGAIERTGKTGYDVKKVLGLSESEVEDAFGEKSAVYKLYKAIKDLEKSEWKDMLNRLLKLMEKSMTYQEKIDKAAADRDEDKRMVYQQENEGRLPHDKVRNMLAGIDKTYADSVSKIRWEQFEDEKDLKEVTRSLSTAAYATMKKLVEDLEEILKEGVLTTDEKRKAKEELMKLKEELVKRNPFSGLFMAIGMANEGREDKDSEKENKGRKLTLDSVKSIQQAFKNLCDVMNPVIGLFDAFGMHLTGLREGIDILDKAFSSAVSTGNALDGLMGLQGGGGKTIGEALGIKNAGAWGAVAGFALSMTSSLLAAHDKALEKEIQASKARQEMLEKLSGKLKDTLEAGLGGVYNYNLSESRRKRLVQEAESLGGLPGYGKEQSSLRNAAESGEYYDAAYASLLAQRAELEQQRTYERQKKKTNADKIKDYDDAIDEINETIDNFSKELADSLYGINFQQWADDLASAIVGAWQQGTDAVEAYKNAVTDVIRTAVTNRIADSIIAMQVEPIMEEFLAQFEADKGKLETSSVAILGKLADAAGVAVEQTYAVLEELEPMMNARGISLRDTNSSSGLSASIAGVTEQTADLLASYVNSVRADVAFMRQMESELSGRLLPDMNVIAQSQLEQIMVIVENTRRNALAAERIEELFDGVTSGTRKVYIA